MGIELCGKCHRLHYVPGQCPERSTAAGKDRRTAPNQSGRIAKLDRALLSADAVVAEESGRVGSSPAPAGTQARPVDTTIVGKRRGRPQTITDMKAYRAQKARARRAALKDKRNG